MSEPVCEHKAIRGCCGYRACRHFGRRIPPNPYAKQPLEIREVGIRGAAPIEKAKKRGDASRFGAHPGMVDMTGKVIGGWTVVSRGANVGGNAAWHCRHDCGSDKLSLIAGITLRAAPPKFCDACRPRARKGAAA